MSYRIEICPNNRAGCKDSVCKKSAEKIKKGELRFGTWVEIPYNGETRASWSWKHWGCVSGAQIDTLRQICDQGDGKFEFEGIDGFDEMDDQPELQEKIRRCVKQGHIDPEDFRGDPEKNKPGVKGIHLTDKQKRDKEAAAAAAAADSSGDEKKPKAKAKRSRKKAEDDEDEEEKPQPKKAKAGRKAGTKVKDESDQEAAPPASKKRKTATKVNAEDEDADSGPVKKPRRTSKVKKEESDEEKAPPAAEKKAKKGRKAAAKALTPESEEPQADAEVEEKPAAKKKGGRATKAAAAEDKPKGRRRSSRTAS